MKSKKKDGRGLKNLVFAAVCLALCMLLPLVTGQIPQVGKALSPMHIPVFLCGFICGPWWALAVGAAAPLLRFAVFGMPQLYPMGAGMCFELAAYGLAAGLLYRALPKKPAYVYITLMCAMLIGRAVWGAVSLPIYSLGGMHFTWEMFAAGAFIKAVPGIILHILIVPPIVLALKKAGVAD